jgi:hypothetical protein
MARMINAVQVLVLYFKAVVVVSYCCMEMSSWVARGSIPERLVGESICHRPAHMRDRPDHKKVG